MLNGLSDFESWANQDRSARRLGNGSEQFKTLFWGVLLKQNSKRTKKQVEVRF